MYGLFCIFNTLLENAQSECRTCFDLHIVMSREFSHVAFLYAQKKSVSGLSKNKTKDF